jgi:hypothetical protein
LLRQNVLTRFVLSVFHDVKISCARRRPLLHTRGIF